MYSCFKELKNVLPTIEARRIKPQTFSSKSHEKGPLQVFLKNGWMVLPFGKCIIVPEIGRGIFGIEEGFSFSHTIAAIGLQTFLLHCDLP